MKFVETGRSKGVVTMISMVGLTGAVDSRRESLVERTALFPNKIIG